MTRTSYDILVRPVHIQSTDSGDLWSLHGCNGAFIAGLNNKDRLVVKTYDELRREMASSIAEGSGPAITFSRTVWGESIADTEEKTLRGKAFGKYDQSGIVTVGSYGLKETCWYRTGNLRRSTMKHRLGAIEQPPLEEEVCTASASYGALARVASAVEPDSTVKEHTYNGMSLLTSIRANFYGTLDANGSAVWTLLLTSALYDVAGKRLSATLGNGARIDNTHYLHTKRLTRRVTTARSGLVQDIDFVCRPLGNVISSRDIAEQDIFFRNVQVKPEMEYEYDGLHCLWTATGREHVGQTAGHASSPGENQMSPYQGLDAVADQMAMANYTETYSYDTANNIVSLKHKFSDAHYSGWTRNYSYNEPSQINHDQIGNRLSSTNISRVTDHYKYDITVLTISMPHLTSTEWDAQNCLRCTSR